MNAPARPDWATLAAVEALAGVHLLTAAEATNVLAVALRDARAKGYAEGLSARGPVTLTHLARCETSAHRAALNDWAREHLAPATHRWFLRQRSGDPLQREVEVDHADTVLAGDPGFAGVGT